MFHIITIAVDNIFQGTNRILRAAKKAGMNELTPVPYPKIQEEYLEMFKTPLNPAVSNHCHFIINFFLFYFP